jgi:aminomethyltransferase
MSANLRTPLYQWHVDHKARMVPFGGWEMPVQYAGIGPEHKAVRSSAGLFDISHMARVNVGGSGALALLEEVFTNSVGTMREGQVRYGLVCNDAGGTLDDILVYRWKDGFTAVINAGNHEKVLAWLERRRGSRDATLEDETFNTAMIAVQGPKAAELVAGLFSAEVAGLKYYFATPAKYRGGPCVVSRTGYTGEDGFEATVPKAAAVTLWEEFYAMGATPCGLGARDTLRLEAGMPLYGHELTEMINPIQAGLGWAVKLDKGDFVGREALRAAANDKTQPVRVGLELDGKRAAREGSAITAGGAAAGTVTSGSFCPWLDRSLAMGYAEPQFAAPGTKLQVDVRGSLLDATVVPLPFYRRMKSEK